MSEIETEFNYRFRYFKNVFDSVDQNVDGSMVPMDFLIEVEKKSYVRRIDFVVCSVNIITMLDYGLISGGLPLGIQLLRQDNLEPEQVLFNVQRFIEYGHLVDGQISQVKILENPTENILIASVTFDPIMPMLPGTKLMTRVRDDLRNIRYHRTSILLLEP